MDIKVDKEELRKVLGGGNPILNHINLSLFSNDSTYVIQVDVEGAAHIQFGDGISGS